MIYDLGFINLSEKRKTHLLCAGSSEFACRVHFIHTESLVKSGDLEINEQSVEMLVKTITGTRTLNGTQAMSEHLIEKVLSCRKCVRILRVKLATPPALPLFEEIFSRNGAKPTF
jgi:hypothetical protein